MSHELFNKRLIAYAMAVRYPGLSKEQVAEVAPVCAQTIGRIIDGRNVSIATLKSFTDFLGVRLASLFEPDITEIPQFHRALLATGRSAGGSVRTRAVSGSGRSRA